MRDRPRLVIGLALAITSAVRQRNDEVAREFGLLADNLVVGIVNERGVVKGV